MGLKGIITTAVLALGLLAPGVSSSQDTTKHHIRYTGENYKVTYNNKNYGAKRCYSALDRVNGWCIVDVEGNYITDPHLYSDIALMAEVKKDSIALSPSINKSKEVFDKALNVQLAVDVSKLTLENLSEIEGPLALSWITGGTSLSKAAQFQLVRNTFKNQQDKVYSMYMDDLKAFSIDLLDQKISEDELRQKIKDKFGKCYEYQLKLASVELAKAQRLIQKPNKTYEDYKTLDSLIDDGISRGFMATKALNMVNESYTLDKNFKRAASLMIKGAGLESILEIIVDNPDFENISKEAEKEFYKFYNLLSENKSYWAVDDKNSNASKMMPIVNYLQNKKEMLDNIKKQRTKQANQPKKQQGTETPKPIVRQEPKPVARVEVPKKVVQEEEEEGGRYTYVDQKEKFDGPQENDNDKKNLEHLIRLYACMSTDFKYPYEPGFECYWNLYSRKKQHEFVEQYGQNARNIIQEISCNREVSDLKIKELRIRDPYPFLSSARISYTLEGGERREELINFFKEGKDGSTWKGGFWKIIDTSINKNEPIQTNKREIHHWVSLNVSCGMIFSEEYMYDKDAGWVINGGHGIGGRSELRDHISRNTRICNSYSSEIRVDNILISGHTYPGGDSSAAEDAELVRLNASEFLRRVQNE